VETFDKLDTTGTMDEIIERRTRSAIGNPLSQAFRYGVPFYMALSLRVYE